MVKKAFFRKPDLSDIRYKKNKIEREINLENLVEAVFLIGDDKYLILNNIIPKTSKTGIPYVGERASNYYQKLWQRFLKRGYYIELNTKNTTITELKEGKEPPYKVRERLFNNARLLKEPIAGLGWWDPKTKVYNTTNLDTCIQGAKILAYSDISNKEEDQIKILNSYDLRTLARYMGADIIMRVPSEEIDQDPYIITLRSVPVHLNNNRFELAWSFHADHSCAFKATRITKRHSGREHYNCHHIIAAYLFFAKDFYYRYRKRSRKERLVPLEMCLFPIPTEFTIRSLNKFLNHVIFRYRDRNGEYVYRAPNMAHEVIFLSELTKNFSLDNTFYSTKKLKEYDWASEDLNSFLKS